MRLTAACVLTVYLFFSTSAVAQPQDDRPPDPLLQRSDLQAVVDAQVRRDGPALIGFLDRSSPDVRARAAFALASVQDTAAVSALTDLLRDSVPEVRADAAFALGQMPGGVSAGPLLDALAQERDDTVQRRLVEAVGKTGEADVLSRLIDTGLPEILAPDVALAIARHGIRGTLADSTAARQQALDWLVARLRADRAATRRYVAYFFGRIDAAVWKSRADSLRSALDSYDRSDPAAPHLIRALGSLGDRADAGRLQRWLREAPDWRTRVNAARALAPIASALRTRETLTAALRDSVHHVAVTAAQSLAEAPWGASDATLISSWMDAHPDRWRVLAPLLHGAAQNVSLDAFTPSAILDRVDRWSDRPVPYAAMLGALAPLDSAATGLLTRVASSALRADSLARPGVAAAALSALGAHWGRGHSDRLAQETQAFFHLFARGVASGDPAVVNAAAPVLADSTFQKAGLAPAATLQSAYDSLRAAGDLSQSVESMTAILRALGSIPPDDAQTGTDTAFLRSVLEEAPHPVIASAAAGALSARTGTPVPVPPTDLPDTPPIDWEAVQALGPAPELVLQTEKGSLTVSLDATQAPQTVETMCGFANDGRYDGVPFHRVVPNFVIQGGDFAREDGWGGAGFFIRSEFTRIPYTRGVIGMASAGADTEGSQFFLTHSMQPHLDGRYTAFGSVARGLNAMDAVATGDRIHTATCRPDR